MGDGGDLQDGMDTRPLSEQRRSFPREGPMCDGKIKLPMFDRCLSQWEAEGDGWLV